MVGDLRKCAAAVLSIGIAAAAVPATAQQELLQQGATVSPILTVDFDRMFSESAYGEAVTAALEERGAAIAAENRRIEAELTAEERALTEKRRTMEQADFRELANAFDEKVQELRREQDAKARALGNASESRRRLFLATVEPVIGQIMRESGALVVLDKRQVLMSVDAVDITDTAIDHVDAAVEDGSIDVDDIAGSIADAVNDTP
ncbi:molecular chaperone Skp [Salipiger pallidus]|uniref:Molecular chaperone Skp n=1 Tax=Salipiger pallidus TaxID=1775170 RepID=A0A8J2ZG05_9RHOB|nr:OmpH family outer membrane protein [Salipiger pallidus]GGG58707.1 molecular chaperone Skp [Salipiger pallidus]